MIQSETEPPTDEMLPDEDVAAERVPLGRLLVAGGFLTEAQLEDALYEGSRTGERIGEVVVRRGLATDDDVARLLAEQWGLEYVERSEIWFDPSALALLAREDAQRLEALPMRIEGGHVVVAVAEPTEQRLEALRNVIGDETVVIVVPKPALEAGLRSQLLASRGDGGPGADELPAPVPADEEPPPPPAAPLEAPPVVHLTPVTAPPDPEPSGDDSADAVVALAAEARAVVERLAAQASAVQAQAHVQQELRRQAEEYEARIAALELQVAEEQARVERVRAQLAALLEQL